VENLDTPTKIEPGQDEMFLKSYNSTEADPQEFFLEFTTYGNVRPIEILQNACDNIIERLDKLQTLNVDTTSNEVSRVVIRGEDHTIGELIKREIYTLDPGIGLINSTLEHPQIRTITINIKHPNPQKIFQDAVQSLIKKFQSLKKQFSNAITTSK
jgi:DNA-directed RNA polymerase subunit L